MYEMTEEAVVAASVDTVWRDWADAAAVAEWVWPPRFETTAVIEPQPQGAWELHSDVAGLAVVGKVLEVDPPHRLRLAWRWGGEEEVTDADVTFAEAPDSATRVVVHHTGFETPEQRDLHIEGWSNCLQRLVERYSAPTG